MIIQRRLFDTDLRSNLPQRHGFQTIFRGKLHLELSLGIGYFYSRATSYEVFERGGNGYRDKNYRKNVNYFGPLKATVAFVLPL